MQLDNAITLAQLQAVVVQGNNAQSLQSQLYAALPAIAQAFQAATIEDIGVSGAGAGNVFQAWLLIKLDGGNGPLISDVIAGQWLVLGDHTTAAGVAAQLATYQTNNPALELLAWDNATAGNGALYLAAIMVRESPE